MQPLYRAQAYCSNIAGLNNLHLHRRQVSWHVARCAALHSPPQLSARRGSGLGGVSGVGGNVAGLHEGHHCHLSWLASSPRTATLRPPAASIRLQGGRHCLCCCSPLRPALVAAPAAGIPSNPSQNGSSRTWFLNLFALPLPCLPLPHNDSPLADTKLPSWTGAV